MLHDVGLAAALTWLQGWAQQQYGLTVDLRADPGATPVARDVRTLVFESVKELVFNAVKHAKVDRLAIELALTEAGDVHLTVTDGGAGFEPEDLLATGRTRGTGFGLIAIRERLASLGGRLDIEAAPGRGARFTLTVPRLTPSPEVTNGVTAALPQDPAAGPDPAPGRPLRIVLADDHALVRDGLRQLLADHPALDVVGEASDGVEAVALVDALRPDVVIMDVAMPRMDGIEATRRIHAATPHVVILGLSTQERPRGLHAIEDAGAAGYFAKGDDAQRLLERLLEIQRAGNLRAGHP
jgi:CheY-like chemotaxis protein